MDLETVAALGNWGYVALFALLLLTSVGSPLPEDLLLLFTGFLISSNAFALSFAAPVAVLGVVVSDVALYTVGRQLAWRATSPIENTVLTPKRLDRATSWFERFGPAVIFFARLVPGTRALVFVTAGIRSVPGSRFVLMDVLGAMIWVPVMLFAGARMGDRVGGLDELGASLARAGAWVAGGVLLLLAAWIAWGREESKL